MKKNVLPALCCCFLLTALFFSAFTAKKNKLDGTWLPLRQEIGGQELPAEVYENQQLILKDSTYTLVSQTPDKGIMRVTGNKMDIYGKEGVNVGKHFTAIYKLEKGQLTICYDLTGAAYPENFDTKGKAMCFLSVFKKQGAK